MIGEKTSHGPRQATLWLPTHRDTKAGGEIRVREIEASFTFLRYWDRCDNGIDPAALNGVQ